MQPYFIYENCMKHPKRVICYGSANAFICSYKNIAGNDYCKWNGNANSIMELNKINKDIS